MIVLPLLVLLLMWSTHFTDRAMMTLAAHEAARLATWELAVERPVDNVRTLMTRRFPDLSSPVSRNTKKPAGVVTLTEVQVSAVTLDDDRGTLMGAPDKGESSDLSEAARLAGGIVDRTTQMLGFGSRGGVQATITLTARKPWAPRVRLVGERSHEKRPETWSVTVESPVLVADLWRAWPGRYALASQDRSTPPRETYGRGSAPERELAARLKRTAFLGLGERTAGPINNAAAQMLSWVALPSPFSTETWADGGPVALLPGAPAKRTFSPAFGQPVQRLGDVTRTDFGALVATDAAAINAVDSGRTTGPAARLLGREWQDDGGTKRHDNADINPYARSYACRDAWFLGSARPAVPRWGRSFREWVAETHPACHDGRSR